MAFYTVTLLGYSPPPRSDGIRYVQAIIEQSSSAAGPWEAIETLTANPGPNAEELEALNFTTDEATLEAGFYRVTWVDEDAVRSTPSAPARNLAVAEGGIRPTVPSVAMLLRARTKIKGGKEEGTFTSATRPTPAVNFEPDPVACEGLADAGSGCGHAAVGAGGPGAEQRVADR